MATEAGGAARLEQLRGRIEHWRRTRTKHGPMPEALWDEAALLARGLGVCPVSRALGIGYESLQERVADTVAAQYCIRSTRRVADGRGGECYFVG